MTYRTLARALLVPVLLGVLCLSAGSVNARTISEDEATVKSEAGDFILGDSDCSATVDLRDVVTILAQSTQLGNAPCPLATDVDCDGFVGPIDALKLLGFQAGVPIVVAAGIECETIGQSMTAPPRSEELIAAALQAGDITYEQSLLYRAYALYDHPDLPDEFRSPIPDMHAGLELFREIAQNESQLSPGLLDQLAPFSARPADPISIFNNPPGGLTQAVAPPVWHSIAVANGQARVWVKDGPGWDYELTTYAATVTKVWNALPGLIRYGIPDTPGAANINPDGAIDIYFVNTGSVDPRMQGCGAVPAPDGCAMASNGLTRSTAPNAGRTFSAYVLISTARQGDALINTLGHELGHVGQFTYDAYEPFWLMDATATWTAFRVVQKTGARQTYTYERLPAFFKGLNKPLTRDTEADLNRYGSWLFFLFASMEKGDGIVTKVWEKAAADGVQNEQAVNQAFPFADNFDDFAVRNWNMKPPLLKSYRDADNTFPAHRPTTKPYPFGFDEERTESDSIPPLASVYYDYKFGDLVHKVKFTNLITGHPTGRIWALIKTPQGWKDPLELTNTAEKLFCRDLPVENVSELVIIVSNSQMTSALAGPKFKLKANVESCHGWVGTATGTYLNDSGYYERSITTANAIWEEEFLLYGCNCRTFIPQGSISWSWDYDDPNNNPPCHDRATAHKSAPVQGVDKFVQALTFWQDPVNANQYYYSALGFSGISRNISCQIGGSAYVPQYINVPVPDINPFPSGSPTPYPIPSFPFTASSGSGTGAPGSKPQAAPAAGSNLCEDQTFTITKETVFFSGNCYESKDDTGYLKYEWSFSRVNVNP